MKQTLPQPILNSPIPPHIFPIPSSPSPSPSPSSSIIATSYSNDKFTIPKNDKTRNSLNTGRNDQSSSSSSSSPSSSSGGDGVGRVLCSDRKGFFDHLRPRSLIFSSCRVTILQAAQVLSSYVTDQLKFEIELNDKLESNQITHLEYESSLLSFENDEWDKRWKQFLTSNKIWLAIGKFHLLTLFIRSYETLLYNIHNFRYCDVNLDMVVLDKFTKDTYSSAVRKSRRLKEFNESNYDVTQKYHHVGSDGSSNSKSSSGGNGSGDSSNRSAMEVTSKMELGKQMFYTCFYANAIPFLSDLTVQQSILLFGYYRFFVTKERERKLKRLKEAQSNYEELKLKEGKESREEDGDDDDDKEEKEKEEKDSLALESQTNDDGVIFFYSFFRRSSQITFTRAIGLVAASFGGALGSIIYPGWGTVFGTQMGDAAVGVLFDD